MTDKEKLQEIQKIIDKYLLVIDAREDPYAAIIRIDRVLNNCSEES